MKGLKICLFSLLGFLGIVQLSISQDKKLGNNPVWTKEKANNWYRIHPWINGADYIPNTSINQLEMWQKESFDPQTIDHELRLAEGIGFNTLRVFLHSLAWKQDPEGFKTRMESFLRIASHHKIKPLFVFFDDCWNKEPKIGIQAPPKPGIHNSGWVQDPGQPASEDSSLYPFLKSYVQDILIRFKKDPRILLWDLYNEPGNSGKGDKSLPLLESVFAWAREINPDQPLTAGVWNWNLEKLYQFQILHSDIITYHNYSVLKEHKLEVEFLEKFGRPLICTEYMARPLNSRFETIMPFLKAHHIGAINWGFVSGKTNTIYAWDTPIPDGSEPKLWFHDIFRKDGSPYLPAETQLIRKLNGKR